MKHRPVGRVSELWRFPVKSMQGEPILEADISELGIERDRSLAVRDARTGKVLSAKRYGKLLEARARLEAHAVVITLPGEREYAYGEPAVDDALSAWLGLPVVLAEPDPEVPVSYEYALDPLDAGSEIIDLPCPPSSFHDAAALHLMTTSSLTAASAFAPSSAWAVRRFRPGILLQTHEHGYPEESWIGSDIAIGDAIVVPFAPTIRCAMPTRAQPTLKAVDHAPLGLLVADRTIIRSLTDHHNNCLGVYATVKQPGRVKVGDAAAAVRPPGT